MKSVSNLNSTPTYVQLHHVAIQVRDLETSLCFYQTLFGLLIERHFHLDEEEVIWLKGNGWRLELLANINQEEDSLYSSSSSHHFALEVTDLAKWEQVCHQLQIKIIEGPLTLPDGTKIMFIEGPDNEQIEFIQPVTAKKP